MYFADHAPPHFHAVYQALAVAALDHAFEAVSVDREFGTIVWPGHIDLDPDVLRGDQPPASGRVLPRRVVQPA